MSTAILEQFHLIAVFVNVVAAITLSSSGRHFRR